MADQSTHLLELAANVADGARVDWDSTESAAGSDDERELVRGMRLLEAIASVHASLPATSSARSASRRTPVIDLTHGSEPVRWGPLHLTASIGHGTFGDVYRAWDTRLDREVALKLLVTRHDSPAAESTLIDSAIIDEGRLMARVRHPNIATVYGAEQIDGHVGVWMELVDGRTLDAVVRDHGPLPASEVLQIGLDLAGALTAVHRAGLVHRDIKAQNVMRETGGRIVLMDFGTGLEVETSADATMLAGTPLYLAPEVLAGGAASSQSDVYSLGILLFYLATGAFPVRGATLHAIRRAHARRDRTPLRQSRPDFPGALARVIERATSPDLNARFADATTFAEALRAVERSPHRQRRAMAVAAAAVTVLAMIGVIWQLATVRDPGPTGIQWDPLPADLVTRANIRGPSIDGRELPCSAWGLQEIAMCDLVTQKIRPLRRPTKSTEGVRTGRALLSPNGRLVAYKWQLIPQPLQMSMNVIGVDGRGDREIYRADAGLEPLRWTTDGQALIVREHPNDSTIFRVLRVPVAGGPATLLREWPDDDSVMDLSPDGQTLLLERPVRPGDRDLVAIDVATGHERWRRAGATDDRDPLWTPDGRSLVFVSDPHGCPGIYRQHVSDAGLTGEPELLRSLGVDSGALIGFGSAGVLLVSFNEPERMAFMAEVNLADRWVGPPRSLWLRCDDRTVGADWHHDGKRIAYISGRLQANSRTRVAIRTRDDTIEREFDLPEGSVGPARVRWSPNGQSLAFSIGLNDGGSLVGLVDLAAEVGREIVRTQPRERRLFDPAWDRDGHGLYVREGRRAIMHLDLKSGARRVVYDVTATNGPPARLQEFAGFDVARTDGALLVGASVEGTEGCRLRIVTTDGRVTERHHFKDDCQGLIWTRDGAHILVGTFAGRGGELWLLPRESGDPVRLPIDAPVFRDLSLSPDERHLLFSAGNSAPQWAHLRGIR